MKIPPVFRLSSSVLFRLWPAVLPLLVVLVLPVVSYQLPVTNPQPPYVSGPVAAGRSPAARDLPTAVPWQPGDPVYEGPSRRPLVGGQGSRGAGEIESIVYSHPCTPAPLHPCPSTPDPILNFPGIGATGYIPPDTNGDVGPNHYVQAVNVQFAIWDKSGNLLAGPTNINQLWQGQGGPCEQNNDGDPIVLYDPLADRWLIAQFALPGPYYMCVAISQTADPLADYYLYTFQTPGFPDYPKFGVWPDAYYMSTNENGTSAYALEREEMLNGLPAALVRFNLPNSNFLLPSDVDGLTPPPAGAPNVFYTFTDQQYWGGGPDRLELYEFHVDWADPGNSTFVNSLDLTMTPFIYTVCGYFNFSCIRQPAPGARVDAISEWPMFRFAYRNLGDYEALVGNFAVDVDNTDHSGIRWFELRKEDGGGWTLYQEGTHAPDEHSRWVGSMAMDRDGNIALGYSVSSLTLRPAIRYATRLASDPPGTLQAEASLIEGDGVQLAFDRWGDYSAMSIDPADDCTFWYTNEYYPSNSSTGWQTQIGAFRLPECGGEAADLALTQTAAPEPILAGAPLTYTLILTNNGPLSATNTILTDTLPAGVTVGAVTVSQGSCQSQVRSSDFSRPVVAETTTTNVTCDLGTLLDQAVVTATIVVTPTVTGIITNTAVVSADQPDNDLDNNTATATTTVLAIADLALGKTASAALVDPLAPLTYTLTLTNNGPYTATGATIADTLPAGVTFVAASSSCLYDGLAHTVTCSVGSLAAGSVTTVIIEVLAPAEPGVEFTNTADVAGPDYDPDGGNDGATVSVRTRWVVWLPVVRRP